jgi:hypothetical protein
MLVWELMEACISVCTCVKSSIHRSSRPIPSVEFSLTYSLEDQGMLFVHSNPLEQVDIVYTSVTKLLLMERLILLHLLSATDGNAIAIHGHRNVIVVQDSRLSPQSRAVKARRMKTMWSLVIHHRSMSQSLGWMGQTGTLASLHLSISSSCIALATTTYNNMYVAPYVLALAEHVEGNKGLCREITSDDASKKTSLLQH